MLEHFKRLKQLFQLNKVKDKWRMKTPKQKWQTIYDIGARMSEIIGIRVYTDMKIYWYSYIPGVLISMYFFMVTFTIWLNYQRGDILRGMHCTCTTGYVIMCATIYMKSIGSDRTLVNNAMSFAGKYIYKNERQPSRYNKLCEKMIGMLIQDMIIILVMLFLSYFIFGIGFLYAIIIKHIRVTFLATELPFFDINSNFGYAINLIPQLLLAAISVPAIITVEIGTVLALNFIHAMPEIVHHDLEELANELKVNGMSLGAKVQLRNVFMKLQDLNGFQQEIVDVEYWRFLAGPFILTYSISFSIFGQLILGYPSGYGCAVCNFILLLIFCIAGESVKQANQRLALELYQVPWYLLSPAWQKEMACAIHMAQNRPILTIGPFGDLNLDTAADLTKSAYRFTMMLNRISKSN